MTARPLTPEAIGRLWAFREVTAKDDTRISRYSVEPATYGDVRALLDALDAARARADAAEAALEEARKHPGIDDPRVAAINDAVTDFVTRRTEPRLVCYHVPMLQCEVLMYAVGDGLPKAVTYAQFIHALERSAGIEADSGAADRAEKAEAALAAAEADILNMKMRVERLVAGNLAAVAERQTLIEGLESIASGKPNMAAIRGWCADAARRLRAEAEARDG